VGIATGKSESAFCTAQQPWRIRPIVSLYRYEVCIVVDWGAAVVLLIDVGRAESETKRLTLIRGAECKRSVVTGRISRAKKCFFLGVESKEFGSNDWNARFTR